MSGFNLQDMIAAIKYEFSLTLDDEYKLAEMHMAGCQFLCAGVSTWIYRRDLKRFTRQIPHGGLNLISDGSCFYDELMDDLDGLQESLLKDCQPEDLKEALYIYVLEPFQDLRFVSFTRKHVDIHDDLDDADAEELA